MALVKEMEMTQKSPCSGESGVCLADRLVFCLLEKLEKCQSCHQDWCRASLESWGYGCRGMVWL